MAVIQPVNGREIKVPVGVLIFKLECAPDIYCHPFRSVFTVERNKCVICGRELNAIAEISVRTLVSIIRAPRTGKRSLRGFSVYGRVYIMTALVIVSLG